MDAGITAYADHAQGCVELLIRVFPSRFGYHIGKRVSLLLCQSPQLHEGRSALTIKPPCCLAWLYRAPAIAVPQASPALFRSHTVGPVMPHAGSAAQTGTTPRRVV